jgi:hypothetical protein
LLFQDCQALAKVVFQKLLLNSSNFLFFSVGPIESAIIKSGIVKSFETGLAAYLVAKDLAAEQLKLGNSVIGNAVNAEEEGKNIWRSLANDLKVALVIISCTNLSIKNASTREYEAYMDYPSSHEMMLSVDRKLMRNGKNRS